MAKLGRLIANNISKLVNLLNNCTPNARYFPNYILYRMLSPCTSMHRRLLRLLFCLTYRVLHCVALLEKSAAMRRAPNVWHRQTHT